MLDDNALDLLFRKARSHNGWQDKPVSDALLEKIYELMKWGPTSANSCPARLVFVKSKAAKQRLKPSLQEGNVEKSMTAPVVVIIGMDMEFYEEFGILFPHADAKSWYVGNDAKIKEAAFRDSSLQAAYLMLAARSIGLDCGPMSGFDNVILDAEFFPEGKVRSNFICSLGYGDETKLHPRLARLKYERVCQVL
ncbi:Probable NADH dehydrogenase/NAD(P)H nitroreductase [hydrothermal vent metagenome]|uniref:Probable NADH dehydrogenase/NAD(P)H nitroreductase n=1 Tax=hydrothermal vent metagenome TaxID=652676 RepID=A0A3B0ZU14_9ZZZZ